MYDDCALLSALPFSSRPTLGASRNIPFLECQRFREHDMGNPRIQIASVSMGINQNVKENEASIPTITAVTVGVRLQPGLRASLGWRAAVKASALFQYVHP